MYAPLRQGLKSSSRHARLLLASCLLLAAFLLGTSSLPVRAQSPPAAPTNLTAQVHYDDPAREPYGTWQLYVPLFWSAPQTPPSGNYYYIVERKTGANGTWASVGTSDSPFPFYSDTNLPASTAFVYRVRVQASSGVSVPSNEVAATTLAAPPPAPPAPTGLAATPGDQQVTLTWTGSAQASYYLISVYAPEDDGSNAHVYVPAPAETAVTFTVTGLPNGVGYGFSVAAATWINTTQSGTSYSADSNAVGATPIGPSFRVDAGDVDPYYDASGNAWAADYFSSGGMAAWTNTSVTGTSDPLLYQREIVGSSFSYSLPLLNGTYSLNLLFAETQNKTKGQCLFNVSANGKALLTGFDIYAAAGGANKAVVETFPVSVTNGHLSLTFTATTGQAAIAAISVLKPTPAPSVASLTLSPATVPGGSPSTGTVTLTGPAPANGVTVNLQSSNVNAATVPASVTVSAGQRSARFTVSTTGIASATTATITATAGGVTQTATLTVNPVPPPAAPTHLTVTAGSGSISLSWTAVPTATSYNIYRSTTSGGPYHRITSSPSPVSTDPTAVVGVFYYYTVTSVNSGGESGSSGGASTVLLAGSVSPDVPAPGWAEDMVPTDEADGEGFGPSSSNSINLASGVAENHPGPDLVVYNPVGPSVTYERLYRSALADSGYGSPGLSSGWADNYDLTVQAGSGGTYILRYPNGALETWTPGQAAGTLTPPVGAPYLVSSAAGAFTVTFKDHSTFTFALNRNHAGSGVYWLSQMTNQVGHGVTISRDGSDRLVTVTNDAAPATVLLSFTYDSSLGILSSITGVSSASDTQPRQVNYWFGQAADYSISTAVLLKVSRLNTPTSANVRPVWQYDYSAGANSQPYLEMVAVADPAYPDVVGSNISAQSQSYLYYTGNVVTGQYDANYNSRVYRYGSGMAHVQALNSDGSLAQQWLQLSDPTKRNVDVGENDANNHQSAVTYSNTPSVYLPDSITNRNSQKTAIGYDSSPYANVGTVTDPRHTTTSLAYSSGQIQSAQTGSLAATSYDYYPNGLIHDVYTPQPEMLGGTNTTTYVYDSSTDNLGNVTSVTSPGPNGNTTVSYEYKTGYNGYTQAVAVGEPVAVTVTGPDALGGTSTMTTYYQYDARGNRTAVIDALGNETDFQYNLADQLTTVTYPPVTDIYNPPYRSSTTYTYAYVGGPLMNLNVAGRNTDYVYGHEGELLQVKDSPEGVQQTYDGRYRVTSIIDNRNSATSYTYDAVGNLTAVVYPNHHATDAFDRMAYSYDADNNLITRVDGNGVETDYSLDPMDSLLQTIHYPGGQLPNVSFSYDAYGRRLSMTDQTGSKSYTYDDLDNLLTQTTSFTNGPQNQTFTYHFFPNGSRKQMVTPLGAFGYQYDGLGRMTQASFPWQGASNPPANAAYNYTYYANGWLQQAQGPSTVTSYSYNPRGFLISLIHATPSGAPLSSFTNMRYDSLGNRDYEAVNTRQSTYWQGEYVGYNYSAGSTTPYNNYRSLTGESGQYGYNTSYSFGVTYDAAGNPNGGDGNRLYNGFTYNSDNQLLGPSGKGYQYDGNGNPSQYQSSILSFDAENRLTKAPDVNYRSGSPVYGLIAGYDGDDLRAWKAQGYAGAPATYYLYDGSTPVIEENASGAVTNAAGWGADGLRMRYAPAAGFAFSYTFDPQGNLSQRIRYGGVFSTSGYDGFGWPEYFYPASQYDASYKDSVGFGGQYGYYYDVETGLVLLTHRYYDPQNGRFLTRDPVGYAGGLNLYSLGLYNPVNNQDPNGTDVKAPGFAESLIPVWGSGREAIHDFQVGKWGWGAFNTVLAVSDVFLVKAALVDIGKVGIKGLVKVSGSHSWSATKSWMTRQGWREYRGQPFHHWMLEQNEGIGRNAPNWLKNQPWNLKGIPQSLAQRYGARPIDIHNAIHGDSRVLQFNQLQRLYYGTPDWLKPLGGSVLGRGVNQFQR